MTVKFRIGIDDDHHTHLDAGRIAEAEGAAAVALHARTAAQRYSGTADWEQIAQLKQHVRTIPVLGNGDIYDASDALAMMATHRMRRRRHRPRLPGPAVAVRRAVGRVHRQPAPTPPTLGEVADIVRRHGQLLAAHFGEDKGMRDIRKHIAWYLHGFPAGSELRRALALVKTLDELDSLLRPVGRQCPVSGRGDWPPRPAGFTGPRGPARGLADRPRRLHGAGRSGRHALGRLDDRNALEIASGAITQYDVGLAALRFGGGSVYPAARGLSMPRHPRSAVGR